MNPWPFQKDCVAFYGDPRGRNGQVSVLWKLRNLTTVKPPFQMYYAGKPVKTVTIHRKCAASLARVFDRIWIASGKNQAQIDRWGVSKFGGSFNFRLMRGSQHISMHGFACAIDLAPDWFPMGKHDHTFVPQVLQAFAAEGWENLPNDRMHFQAALVSGLSVPQPAASPKPAAIQPASKPQSLIGENVMATLPTTINSASVKNFLNTFSLSGAFTLVGASIPVLYATFGAYGLAGAGALLLFIFIQACLPVGTVKAIESGALTALPFIEQMLPQFKAMLEEVAAGIRAAQTLPEPGTTTTVVASTKTT